jgi:hypothetical protein
MLQLLHVVPHLHFCLQVFCKKVLETLAL